MRLATAILIFVVLPAVCLPQGNLVRGGDFENGLVEGWLTDVIVGPVDFEICTAQVHAGEQSLRLDMGENGRGIVRSPALEVEPGRQYQISVWARAEGAPDDMVYARVHWWAGQPGVAVEGTAHSDTDHSGGTFDWREMTATVTAPPDARTATVRLETAGDTGVLSRKTDGPFTVRFDDLLVEPVE